MQVLPVTADGQIKLNEDFKRKRCVATTIICIVAALLFADQNIIAPNMTSIALFFNFSEIEKDWKLGGELASGFFLLAAPVAVFVGHLADKVNRCKLLILVVLIGEISCLLTYWVQTYTELFVLRTLTGISVGGVGPIIFSLLGDFYPGESRVHVSMVVAISMSSGVMGGQLFSGIVGSNYGWRLPFLLIPIPAIIFTLLLFILAGEPKRGCQDYVDTTAPIALRETKRATCNLSQHFDCRKIKKIFTTPSLVLIYLQGIVGCVPWGVMAVYLNDYLSYNRGYTIMQATIIVFVFGIGGFTGLLLAGLLGQMSYNYDKRLQCLLMGSTTTLGVIPLFIIINCTASVPIFLAIAFIGGLLASITGPNVGAVTQNVTSYELRGLAFGIGYVAGDLGKGGGPIVVAWIISATGSRQKALNIGISMWILCGILLTALTTTVIYDEQNTALQNNDDTNDICQNDKTSNIIEENNRDTSLEIEQAPGKKADTELSKLENICNHQLN